LITGMSALYFYQHCVLSAYELILEAVSCIDTTLGVTAADWLPLYTQTDCTAYGNVLTRSHSKRHCTRMIDSNFKIGGFLLTGK